MSKYVDGMKKFNTLMLLDPQDNMREDHIHLFLSETSQDRFWYSLCGEAMDDLETKDQFIHLDIKEEAQDFLKDYELEELPPLCETCRLVRTMLELAE